MRTRILISACLVELLVLPTPAGSAIRINGNQLLEGAGSYNRSEAVSSSASIRHAPAGVPARIVYSLGQGIMARGRLPDSMSSGGGAVAFRIGIGLGYDIANVAFDVYGPQQCLVTMTGDVNLSGSITSSDIIYLVNFVFKGGPAPEPCVASGDVNCNAAVTASDVIYMVNHVFKSGDAPCDVCEDPNAMECVVP